MTRLKAIPALMVLLSLSAAAEARAQSIETQKAMVAVIGLDMSSAEIVSWCEARAPGQSAPLRSAWQAWRAKADVDGVTARLDAEMLRRGRDGMAPVLAATRQKLQGAGQPSTVCPQLTSMWASAEFEARRMYPAAYPAAYATVGESGAATASAAPSQGTAAAPRSPATAAPSASTSAGAPTPRAGHSFDSHNYATNSRPTGTVFTVAQMTAQVRQWAGTPYSYANGSKLAQGAGRIFIRGTVLSRGERFYLETRDGEFQSRLSVSAGLDIGAFENQEITLEGELDELPSSMIFLRYSRVVRDPSALRPSPLPSEPGMRRSTVAEARITAPPGRGAKPQDIVGMHYRGYGATGANGYEFREETRLLFRDGWAYLRDGMSPYDLDVAASRRLEPQQWARWRSAGGAYEFQEQDDRGQPDKTWDRKDGRLLPTWQPNQRLDGSFTSTAFYGSIALGGTYSSSSFVFRPDGRYERVGFSRTSSASMAAQEPVGFAGSASSVSDGSGTKSNAGGGNASVYTRSSTRRDDGAKNRGTYRLEGMSIELKADDGTVVRTLCLPIDSKLKAIYLFGRSFSAK